VLTITRPEDRGNLISIQEQIQWRLLNRGEEMLNVIPLAKLAVVWREVVEHSVYTMRIA